MACDEETQNNIHPCNVEKNQRSTYTVMRIFLLYLALVSGCLAQAYRPSKEVPPTFPREFRAAWVACVYNIDWPSKAGLGQASQKAELLRLLNQAQKLKLNAIIFQVRPNADAVYSSSIEPWSPWVSGTMGRSPGYDPLGFCIQEAHRRGIEVHAWFNPFRALPNKNMPTAANHVARTHPRSVKTYRNHKWLDPSHSFAQDRALQVIRDVVRRYDIDGVHIDDYFYPYPQVVGGKVAEQFPDGKSASQRRAAVDKFVQRMYKDVKKVKPWVRVGISPFGIWRPGVPRGIEAGIDAYEHLAADSRKWLAKGWCDYLSPQLYWRISPQKQSFVSLLQWWRAQGDRPVWPGIATSRIQSSEDPGRRASEILKQLNYSRTIGQNWVGHIHWSMKALMQNRDGISSSLTKQTYALPALVPPMPWLSRATPPATQVQVTHSGAGSTVSWSAVGAAKSYAIQARYRNQWQSVAVVPRGQHTMTLRGSPDAVALTVVDRFGNTSKPTVISR